MPTIHKLELKDSLGSNIPKGTVIKVVTSSEADQSIYLIPFALRKKGFKEEDIKKVSSNSNYWTWETVTSDPSEANKLDSELKKYSSPKRSAPEKPEKKEKKRKPSKSKKGFWKWWWSKLGYFIIPLFPILLVVFIIKKTIFS